MIQLGPPYDDMHWFRAGRWWRPPTLDHPGGLSGVRRLWERKRRYLTLRIPLVLEACATTGAPACAVEPAWLLGVLWDELARRDLFEGTTDWLAGHLGRDPSVGPFQITGATGLQVVRFASWGAPYRRLDTAPMRELLLDFSFAARVAAGRLSQILTCWRDAGHDPFVAGGLGPHRVRPVELCGTLYSQGLGSPRCDPRANARGAQIGRFASQAQRLLAGKGF